MPDQRRGKKDARLQVDLIYSFASYGKLERDRLVREHPQTHAKSSQTPCSPLPSKGPCQRRMPCRSPEYWQLKNALRDANASLAPSPRSAPCVGALTPPPATLLRSETPKRFTRRLVDNKRCPSREFADNEISSAPFRGSGRCSPLSAPLRG